MNILKGIAKSLLSAITIAILFALWNDYIYKKDQLTGYWNVTYETVESQHSHYKGLKTHYIFVINQKIDTLSGTGEKTSESLNGEAIEYDTKNRTHLTFDGALNYHVFSPNTVNLIHIENGRIRPSSRILNLIIKSNNLMTGNFISTIAGSKGKVTLIRNQ